MNREIKFRAWDKKRKCIIGTDYSNNWGNSCDEWYADTDRMGIEGIEDLNKDENIELMQFTGMNDLNGKLIYEGDIVKCMTDWNLTTSEMIGQVIFHQGTFKVKGRVFFNTDGFERQFAICELWSISIIGNIYENKGLV